jgi:hypothetical protein
MIETEHKLGSEGCERLFNKYKHLSTGLDSVGFGLAVCVCPTEGYFGPATVPLPRHPILITLGFWLNPTFTPMVAGRSIHNSSH